MNAQSFVDALLSRIDERIDRDWTNAADRDFVDGIKAKARNRLMDNLEVLAFSDVATSEDIDYALTDI